MKKIYSFAFASLTAVLSFLLFSCDFFNSLDARKEISGNFTLSGSLVAEMNKNADAFPSRLLDDSASGSAAASLREAFPSYVKDALYYSVSCSNGSATYEGTVDSSDSANITFKVDVPSGSSTVTAKAFIDEAKTKQVYEGTLALSDVKEDSDLSGKTIELSDIQSGTEKTASVSLPINIGSGTKISRISVSIVKDNASFGSSPWSFTVEEGKTYYFSLSDNVYEQLSETQSAEVNSVPGVYDVEFSFFGGGSASSSGEYLTYWTKQKIIASSYLSTEKWNGNGADSCINPDDGTLEVTEKICNAFMSDVFYIDSSAGSDSGSGSFSSPFRTIQKAVDVIRSLGKTEACTVFLKGNIIASLDADCEDGSFVKIEDSANLTLNITTYPSDRAFSISANGRGRVLYIGSGNNVTLKNVTLEKGYAQDSNSQGGTNGGAVYNKGTLSLENCTVSSCSADGNGGAIYVGGSESSLELTNCTIGEENDQISALEEGVQNTAYAPTSDSNSNYAKGSGGGIYGEDNANIQILSTKIVNCYSGGNDSSSGGGGIYLDSVVCKIDDTLSDYNYQSEIYANGSASSRGVGIYAGNSSVLTLGGSVHHHYTNVLAGVPGIYLNGSTLNLKEHSEIRDNYSAQSVTGSGIFVSGNNCSVNLQGGTVENNSSLNDSYFASDIGYTSSITTAVINISGSSYIGSISSQSAPININGNITGFSGDKICKIYTQITEDKTVLQATSENVNLSSFTDYFKLYDLTNRTEATEYKLSVDSSVSPQIAKIVKDSGSQGGGNSGSEISHTTYTPDGTNIIALDSSVTSFASGITYTISDKEALSALATLVSGGQTGEGSTFVLTGNVNLEQSCPNIGTSTNSFAGTFDGNNYCIYNLSATGNNNSLFSHLGKKDSDIDATVKNLRINGAVTSSQYAGGVAANTYGAVCIMNCISEVDFSSSSSKRYIGGFVGYVNSGTVKIVNSRNDSSITTTRNEADISGFLGYVAGSATVTVRNCVNNGTMTGSSSTYISGFSNSTSTTTNGNVELKYCVNNGKITSSATSNLGAFSGDSYTRVYYSAYCLNEISSGTNITAKCSEQDSTFITDSIDGAETEGGRMYEVSSFSADAASSVASTMNTYSKNDTDYTYVGWITNSSGVPDLDLQIEDVN